MGIFDKILGKKTDESRSSSREMKKSEKAEKKETPPILVEKKGKATNAKPKKIEKSRKAKKETNTRKIAKKEQNIAHKILHENLISEKGTVLASQNKYVFKVHQDAGKFQIKEAVEGYYGVQVVGVNTIRIKPKKRIHGRKIGWKKGFKKAVVTLREGDTIMASEGV